MLDERFLELLTKELVDKLSKDELEELDFYLQSEGAYKKHYELLRLYWEDAALEDLNDVKSFQKVNAAILNHEYSSNVESQKPTNESASLYTISRKWSRVAIAAGIMFFATLGSIFYLYTSRNSGGWSSFTFEEVRTPARTKSVILLSDGTRITLNAKSYLKYPMVFKGNTREVFLTGEAFFDVHRDHLHPFIIHTSTMNVRVLGTQFNVRSYPGDAVFETSLIRGSIEVTLTDRPSHPIILKPKDKLVVKNYNPKINRLIRKNLKGADSIIGRLYTVTSYSYTNKRDTALVETSWLQNKLIVKNDEFKDLADKMQRWYGVTINFANEDLQGLRFTASFERENLNQALDALRLTENFHYKIDNNEVYIY